MADRGGRYEAEEQRQQPGGARAAGGGGRKQKSPLEETDTVEEAYGAEFSESTLDMLRGYQKPSYLQELEDSLDPVEDLDDHLAHGVKIPPATYEALQAAGRDEIEGLEAMRDAPTDPRQQEMVRYRQQLAEGTNAKDLKWLKMRAYYRGLEQLRAERDARKAEQEARRLGAYEVPTDKVPADALSVTALEASQRRKKQLAVAAANARRRRSQGSKQALSSDDLELSSESEWPELLKPQQQQQQQQLQQQLSPELRRELAEQLAAYAAHREAVSTAGTRTSEPAALSTSGVQEGGAQPQQKEQEEQRQLRTVYTDAFLQQQRLQKRVQQQQLQRTMAFWGSLAAVSGIYLIRLLRRRLRRGGGKGGKKGNEMAAGERSQRAGKQ